MLFRRQRFRQNSSRIALRRIRRQVFLEPMKILGLTQGMSLGGKVSEICHHHNSRISFLRIRQYFDSLFHSHLFLQLYCHHNSRIAFRRIRQ
jgi:hypothetical protein